MDVRLDKIKFKHPENWTKRFMNVRLDKIKIFFQKTIQPIPHKDSKDVTGELKKGHYTLYLFAIESD